MSDKDDKILMEIYKRTYAVATPPADFDGMQVSNIYKYMSLCQSSN
jgi:hypothetical protein